MNLDGITLHVLTAELADSLQGGQISKIYQLHDRGLYFRIFNEEGPCHLIITLDGSPRLYLADNQPATPDVPTALAMFLRKYYENGRIASVSQLHLDRIVEIGVDILDISGKLATRKIHVELMGKYSNVIFTEHNVILEALIKTGKGKTALRTIAPKEPYEFPPNFMRMDPFDFSVRELLAMTANDTDEELGKWMLQYFNGMSTLVLNELALRTGTDLHARLDALTAKEKENWFHAVVTLGKKLQHVRGAYVYRKDNKESIFPLKLTSLAAGHTVRYYSRIRDYLKEFQDNQGSLNGEQEALRRKISKLTERQVRKMKRINGELKETDKMDTYKLYGDLLMIHAYKQANHQKSVTVTNLLSEAQEDIKITLDPALSITDNANKYYKKYTKLRNRKQKSAELQEENQKELDYLESLEYALQTSVTKDELADIKAEMHAMGLLQLSGKEKLKKESAQQILTLHADGMDIWIGRNNRQNDFLTLKKAHPYDLWFHAKNQPGSHVILVCHNGTPTDEQIAAAAESAAYFSRSRHSSKVEVDCTLVRNVKKPARAVPGYVIFDNQTTYIVEPKDRRQDT
ncbi:Rqc2 family fibronectin-binding protein [Colibacter massiliensis]|uniref:Rqc2 family fibronectin-binding protein n=1 Tax=Colibacter massiliensis TaxID=1852379 RepID=UPI002352CDD4|nr:NFACT RNA binding domain-containing protein [Colibacter massiliensis]